MMNDDYPPEDREVRKFDHFDPPQINQCHRYTTRVLDGDRVVTAHHIIEPAQEQSFENMYEDDDESLIEDCGDSDEDLEYDESGVSDDEQHMANNSTRSSSRIPQDQIPQERSKYAYWLAKSKAEAIYGQVWVGRILKRRLNAPEHEPQWQVTDRSCAVKEYRWHRIMEEQGSAEDPRREVAAMQHLQRFHLKLLKAHQEAALRMDGCKSNTKITEWTDDMLRERAEELMSESNVMMPLDVLSDNQFLYTVMPYCNGGELFAVLEERSKFTEGEARYWMKRVLNGIETLQRAGVCHRDMSLENLLTNDRGDAVIIDLGMCIKIPYLDDLGSSTTLNPLDYRTRQRCLIRRDRACGKPYYMSPEIRRNAAPFDGHAVDMWAVGPILFLMVAGFPPWEQASNADERFYYFSNGYLGQTVRSWNLDMSEELLDLLQGMFWADPKRRLSLSQVRAHPWMQGEEQHPPPLRLR